MERTRGSERQIDCRRVVRTRPVAGASTVVTTDMNHISICICTFKRPDFLKRLLDDLNEQHAEGGFTYSVVVADNDCARSAERVVSEFAARASVRTTYCVEPRQNIAL